jgi:hypothetical protein
MKKFYRLFVVLGFTLLVSGVSVFSQVGINTGVTQPDPSAMLDVKSTTKGLLPPRMTHIELNAISNPADGLMVYCTDCGPNGLGSLSMFIGGGWYTLSSNCLNPLSPVTGTHVPSGTQIIWNWNTVSYATGYKWNIINDYASATDMVTSTTKTETGLIPGTSYTRYVWAYNTCGASTATTLSQTLPFFIGQSYGGGIIFYIDGTGQHGLIVTTSDQSTGAQWGCAGTSIPGTSTSIGTGQANTTLIVNGCTTSGIAARICNDLVLNAYSDWFLPSKDELNQMYLQKSVIGGFADNPYWSSSEATVSGAWATYFLNGVQFINNKGVTANVRAVRAF